MSRPTQDTARYIKYFTYRTITFSGVPFQVLQDSTNMNSHRADPLSLAATYGVAFAFLSYSY